MTRPPIAVIALLMLTVGLAPTFAHGPQQHPPPAAGSMVEQMREMHKGHDHRHDFEAIDKMSPEQMHRVMNVMVDLGLTVPGMDAHRGREVFLNKGCVVCHQVNGIGGEIGPSLDASDMPAPMNAFEFAARMWRGAAAMTQMQEALFGEQIDLTGQDLADLVAFAHDEAEQKNLTADQIPKRFRELIGE